MTPSLKHMTDTALGVILALAVGHEATPELKLTAAQTLLNYVSMGIDFTVADDEAEADIPADAQDEAERPAPADKPKRTRRTKAEIAAAAVAEAEAKAEAAKAAAIATATANAETKTDTADSASDPAFDWDAPEDNSVTEEAPVTKDEVIALLNRYSAKHPKKGQGAKEAMAKYGSQSLKDISPGDYNSLARDLRTYLEAA